MLKLASMWCALLLLLPLALGQRSRDELLNWCLDAKNHKSKPGPEDVLFNQCSPWREKSCCTPQTTKDLHLTKMYNMNYNHCPKPDGSDLSAKCFRHFIQDHCFYECDPNIGPWVNKTDRKMAEERFTNVPLCQSDCQSWFEACKDDYTCVDNWPKKLNFKNKNGASCPEGSRCQTFKEIFKSPEHFCENVWDHSWKVVSDKEPCMRVWFSGENPNRKVAEIYVEKIFGGGASVLNIPSLRHLAAIGLFLGLLFHLH